MTTKGTNGTNGGRPKKPIDWKEADKLLASVRKPRKHTSYMPKASSLANLKPYKPGQNGNPKPGNSLKAVLLNALTHEKRVELVNATIDGAIGLVPVAFHEVWDRVEGKLQDTPPPVNNIQVVFAIGKGYQNAISSGDKAAVPQYIEVKDS